MSIWRASRPRKEGEGVLGICAIGMVVIIAFHIGPSFYVPGTPLRRRFLSRESSPLIDTMGHNKKKLCNPWNKRSLAMQISSTKRWLAWRDRCWLLDRWESSSLVCVYWSIVAMCMLIGHECRRGRSLWSIRISILLFYYGYGNYRIERVKNFLVWLHIELNS